jgi:23S rRNA (adenine1618-N6)-methyltransferase
LQNKPAEKRNSECSLHPRNRHQGHYDFEALILSAPQLEPFVVKTPRGELSVDFSDPIAVRTLNQALLKSYYGLSKWEIPPGYLCPPIPGRADYIHSAADLLGASNSGEIPRDAGVHVLDIGVGANCIYPIIGHFEYGWRFTGTDIDSLALDSAKQIVSGSEELSKSVELKLGDGLIKHMNGDFDLTLCNPPFHASILEAQEGTHRKWENLGVKSKGKGPTRAPVLNFGGKTSELSTPGGEAEFIRKLIEESANFKKTVFWFTTLVSKSSNLPGITASLRKMGVADSKTIDMGQGQKKSRFVAWTYLPRKQQEEWRQRRWT